jgi:SAM-dependent methyltransferase
LATGVFSSFLEQQRLQLAAPYLRGRILDLGCGYAAFIRHFHPPPDRYIGVEKNPDTHAWLVANYPAYTFILSDLDMDRLPDIPKCDVVLSIALVEHLTDIHHFLEQVNRGLSDSGQWVVTTPTPLGGAVHSIGSKIRLFSSDAQKDHSAFYNRASFSSLARAHGIQVTAYKPFQWGLNQLFLCCRA